MFIAASLLALPAAAQTASPAPAAGTARSVDPQVEMRMQRGGLFPSVSPEGRAIIWQSMRGNREDRAAVRAARDRITAMVGADRLDVPALRRAMEEERRLVDSHHARRQANLLAAIEKLSPADRKAFAADAQRGRDRMEMRMQRMRDAAPAGGAESL
jgi:hypothetical protein